ncbi:MBL fold metallo-hydrolase [Streptomyces sp. NPDC048664]|uniref:MBL fold metallo-hydrolase n=1 Tax=Streptomyces sp. NPDC048664 TaxID=3154505 RepID=UPI00342BF986
MRPHHPPAFGQTRANPAWNGLSTDCLRRLTASEFAPESVDLAIITHPHTDHVGWKTRLKKDCWAPTFSNARYLTSRTEWNQRAADVPDGGTEIADGIRLIPAPGHTPGQIAVEPRGGDRSALITGDTESTTRSLASAPGA